ncbi:TadE/TadG family type IV pilus assembly protein [Phyllobacterium myrsinacearum]|uniref:Flp pilus assembly protein TadG n=1 Tax=Phyllobacterium myrsinacearum TaxID=28101 RepID=A0A839EG74_9HYPH|nr:TadE/TadG family type IV pilus assembly protein [Phyllobacterium myrsinacearum]MBA8877295.1 Flp pilus assembly protein TadG [Phyllobacterium myrsinacearum]
MEFALIAPVMLLLFLGIVEVTNGFDVNKKLARAGTMVGDLVTQQQSIAKEKVADIMEIATSVLLPYQRDLPKITVTSINVDKDGKATVGWSLRKQGQTISTPYTSNSAIGIDPNLQIPDSTFVRVEMSISYIPLIAWTMKDPVTTSLGTSGTGIAMSKMLHGQARQGKGVVCTNC